MNTSTLNFPTGEHISFIVPNVFETMLLVPVTNEDPSRLPDERVSGSLGMVGEHVDGTVYLHVPEALARAIVGVLQQPGSVQNVSDRDVHDVVGELTNMIGGSLKSLLNDADITCGISTPSVIRGAFTVKPPPGVRAEKFYFECLGHRFAVEVHLQFN